MEAPPVQSDLVINQLHNFPRFGHSSHIAKLASYERVQVEDYIRGLLSLCTLLWVLWVLWSLTLLVVKYIFYEYVGCAAGGQVVDVAKLRKARIPRPFRRRRIVRSWRVQWAFVVGSITIPVASILMLRNGLAPFLVSLDHVQSISDDVEAIAFRGISIASSLMEKRQQLHTNFTRQDLNMSTICPQNNKNMSIINSLHIPTIVEYIVAGLDDLDAFMSENVLQSQNGLDLVINTTHTVDESIEWSHSNDYLLKFFLLVINVVNMFFLFGIFLSKQDIASYKYHQFLSYGFIPLFVVLIVIAFASTCFFGMSAMANADFCVGSPENTIEDFIVERKIQGDSLIYESFMHYSHNCIGESPFGFIEEMQQVIQYTMNAVNLLEEQLQSFSDEGMELSVVCGPDVGVLFERLPGLTSILDVVRDYIIAVVDLVGCENIAPILRRILHGATCTDTIDGLAWLFGCMCAISVAGMVMMSTRAGLFNAVIKAPRRKRKREREKEFDEYKDYMDTFYEDTEQWKLEHFKNKPVDVDGNVAEVGTFETAETTKPDCVEVQSADENDGVGFEVQNNHGGGDDNDDDDTAGAHFASASDDEGFGSDPDASYESDYSSESSDDEKSFMSSSFFSRIFHNSRADDSHFSAFGGSDIQRQRNRGHVPSILDLQQTPRQRRRNLLDENVSHNSEDLDMLMWNETTSPLSNHTATTPQAPRKPRRSFHRTNGALKMGKEA